ncbi:hypothetical protein OAA64_01350 [bacterium]|nr:hypothetical protein [bacterium]
MADFRLDRIRFNWKNAWAISTAYTKDDIIHYEGSTYVALVGHTSNATSFYADYGTWPQTMIVTMARNTEDTANVFYINGQEKPALALKRGLTYVFNLDDATNDTHQFLLSSVSDGTHVNGGFTYDDGVEYYINKVQVTKATYISQYTSATYREIRITVADDNINLYYFCHAHTGMGNSVDLSTSAIWELQAPGIKWSGDWATSVYYEFGDTVNYNGIVYQCIYPHNSAGTAANGLEVDQHNWIALAKAIDYKNNWLVSTRYRVNDVVRYGAKLFRCITGHTSAGTLALGLANDQSKWIEFFDNTSYLQDWLTNITYKVNDLVKEGGSIWRNTVHHTSTTFAADHTSGYWSLFIDGLEFDNEWTNIDYYQIGDVVNYGGYQYRAKVNNTNIKPQGSASWQPADAEYNNGAIINVTGDGNDFFKREVTTNGVRIMAAGTVGGQTAVPDPWLEKVGRMVELFTDPTGAGINESSQRNLIKTLSGDAGTYHAGLPTIQRVARGAGADYTPNFLTDAGIISWNLTDLFDNTVQNDMVWYLNSTGDGYGDGDQDAQEVIEHIFHTLHMHGLDARGIKLYPQLDLDWATSDLYAAMVEAYDAGKWSSAGYGGAAWKTDGAAFEVAAKEYLYLLNFAMFEYTELWDGGSLAPEWTDDMRTQAGIQANNPLGYAFYNTHIAPVISKPSLATIRSIFQDGNTPAQDDPRLAGASGYVVDPVTWQQVLESYKFRDDYGYDSSLDYRVGDTIRHNGNLYTAILDNVSIEPPSEVHWKLVVPGTFWQGQWADSQEYKSGDLVTYGSNTYKAKQPHLGSLDKRPDTDVAGSSYYWELFAEGFSTNVLTTRGDLITYANNGATLNKQRFVKGLDGNILSSDGGISLEWTAADYVAKVYYVSADGIDGTTKGTSLSAPFRTIKYAADYIRANDGINIFNRTPYDIVGLTDQYVLSSAVARLAAGDTLTTAPNLKILLESINPNTGFAYGDLDQSGSITVADSAFIYRYEAQDGSNANTAAQNTAVKDIITAISTNVATYVGEYVTRDSVDQYVCYTSFPNTTIFVKTGVYSEVLPISLPRNCALVGDELRSVIVQPAAGYEQSKMFYVNSGCGIRNMSMQGLSDFLGVENAFLTKRPTNDACYVSLDPGTGPSDSTVWIYKSPYIQNVSTFGSGCTGLKIDGDLHNGGYDSVVANDFTQVLSDGIGVWVNNLARSELVSVFTYYNHIGYLAENGGKIRGTNGNNSYGKYGSVAEGIDNTETAITATVNNRSTEAKISNVMTDGNNILAFEYSNAGLAYTSATYGLTGTGVDAAIANANVVNGGIYQVRLTGTGESPLGAGYVQLQGNAQDGPADVLGKIKISAADSNTYATYAGMRIIIVSGAGAGQYGYITAYDIATKDMVIAKESDGLYGWDHVAPGTALEIPDSTSRYSIEPRVIIPAPPSGTQAFIRLDISGGGLGAFKIINPGSGYTIGAPPSITITDPNKTAIGSWTVRVGNGVLAQPTWTNRGSGYVSAVATVSGDGYADEYQIGKLVHVTGMTNLPGPGANVQFAGNSVIYRLVDITNVTGSLGNQTAQLTVSPLLVATDSPEHNDAVTIRESYSQVRLTGHDFLDIGSGNISDTDYPTRYLEGYNSLNEPTQAYEAVDSGGGRVFYTSTDQDGNFRVGELFEVEQATGIITLNADSFELDGLEELRLGGVRLGGTSATVREFSTDGTMSANSDEVVPTQKATKAFIESRIGGGSANLTANGLVAGQIEISSNNISTETNRINITSDVYFQQGIMGSYLQQALFLGNG